MLMRLSLVVRNLSSVFSGMNLILCYIIGSRDFFPQFSSSIGDVAPSNCCDIPAMDMLENFHADVEKVVRQDLNLFLIFILFNAMSIYGCPRPS